MRSDISICPLATSSNPPNPWNHEIAQRPDQHIVNSMPYSLRLVCGFFNVPQGYEHCNKKTLVNCSGNLGVDTSITWKQQIKFAQNFLYLREWFHQQNEFKTEFERIEVNKMKKRSLRFTFLWEEMVVLKRKLVCCQFEQLSTPIWTHRQTTKYFDRGQLWTCLIKPKKVLNPAWSSLSSREIYKVR